MKTQRRSDSGGSLPSPSHDDYDDFEDVDALDDASVDPTSEQALDTSDDYEFEPGRSPVDGSAARVRPPSSVIRPPASNLPKRRPRAGDAAQAAAAVAIPETPVAPQKGKDKRGNGFASAAPGVVSSAGTPTTTVTAAGGAVCARLYSARNPGLPRLPANCHVRKPDLLYDLCSRLLHPLLGHRQPWYPPR